MLSRLDLERIPTQTVEKIVKSKGTYQVQRDLGSIMREQIRENDD